MPHKPFRLNLGSASPGRTRWARAGSIAAVAVVALSACASADSAPDDSAGGADLTTVTLALDYLPGFTHNGIAYALENGLFEEQGIKLEMLPFSGASADSLVAAGTADIGYSSGFASALLDFSTGAPVTAIFNASPRSPVALGVMSDSGIDTPADLAGALYGGYGSKSEEELINGMIEFDGGTGTVEQIVLAVGSQEALKSGQIDVTALYPSDLLQFEKDGIDVTTFNPAEYGVPDSSGVLLLAGNDWLAENDDLAKGLVAAFQEGYQGAIDDPEAATDALIAQFPDAITEDMDGFTESYAAMDWNSNDDGPVGFFSTDKWLAYAEYAAANGTITDADGTVLDEFDPTPYFTNEYLPE